MHVRTAVIPAMMLAAVCPAYGGWTSARVIDAGNGQDARYPRVACSADGTATVVFSQETATAARVYAVRYTNGAWGAPAIIDNGETPVAELPWPRVGMDDSGNAIAVFERVIPPAPGTTHIESNRFAGASWGAAETLSTAFGLGTVGGPDIAVAPDGTAIATYEVAAGLKTNVWANHFSGTSWLAPNGAQVENGAQDSIYPRIASCASDNAVVIYLLNDAAWACRYTGIDWLSPEQISNASSTHRAQAVAMDADGNAIAVFTQDTATRRCVVANRRDAATGLWSGPVQIDAGGGAGRDGSYPQVAFDSQGNAMAVFEQEDASYQRVYANRFDKAQGQWQGTRILDAAVGGDAGSPQVSADGKGNAIAVFDQYDGTVRRIYAIRYVAGQGWGVAETIDAGMNNDAEMPQIACDSDGNAIAVFHQWDGTNNRVYANRYVPPTPTATPTATPTPTSTPPIDLTANKTTFGTRDRIIVTADVWPLPVPCYPFVRVVMADHSVLYYVLGTGFTTAPTPYLGFEAGTVQMSLALLHYPVLDAQFGPIPKGPYVLEGGAVDMTRTASASNLVYFGTVDKEPLTVK